MAKATGGLNYNLRGSSATSATKAISTPKVSTPTHDYGMTSTSSGASGGYSSGGTGGSGALVSAFNASMMKDQMAFNSAEAQKQRDWEERMSNTAYQRAMEDMKKAGLNPILAYQNGGASTPAGATASSAMAQGATDNETYGETWGYNSAQSFDILAKILADFVSGAATLMAGTNLSIPTIGAKISNGVNNLAGSFAHFMTGSGLGSSAKSIYNNMQKMWYRNRGNNYGGRTNGGGAGRYS